MDEKLLFIADCLREVDSLSQLCSHYGISRKTGYKWLDRYRGGGLDALQERSRRPHTAVVETPYAIREALLELRRQGPEPPGPKKLRALLAARFPDQPPPCRTTIYNILKQAGLIEPQRRRRRVASQAHRLASAHTPNGLWSADYKGQFKTRDGCWCYPLTVMDHASRYLLCCQGLEGTRFAETQAIFERLFREYGLPERMRTDNGVPFASPVPGGLSRLSIWWVRLGIRPERIEPGRPQQNGRHERMHRTLKRAVTHPPARNLSSQQRLFDQFQHQYNEERPHESLAQQTPAHCYTPSVRTYPERLPELAYPSWFLRHKVASNGLAYYRGLRIYMGYLLAGQWVGLGAIGDGVWEVYFGPIRLGRFDERDTRGCLNDYIVLKV